MNRRTFLTLLSASAAAPFTGIGLSIPTIPTLPHPIEWIEDNIKLNGEEIVLSGAQRKYIEGIILGEKVDHKMMEIQAWRQIGYTTATAAYLMYKMIHESNKSFLLLALNHNQSEYFSNILRGMYNSLPNQSMVNSYSWNRFSWTCNTNRLDICTYQSSMYSLRGKPSYDLAFLQEYKFAYDMERIMENITANRPKLVVAYSA